MEIQVNYVNDTLYMEIKGRLDTTTAPLLEENLKNTLTVQNLHLDFKELDYISSAGLRVLLSTLKRLNQQGGKMEIVHLNEEVMEVFEITGFKKLFKL